MHDVNPSNYSVRMNSHGKPFLVCWVCYRTIPVTQNGGSTTIADLIEMAEWHEEVQGHDT